MVDVTETLGPMAAVRLTLFTIFGSARMAFGPWRAMRTLDAVLTSRMERFGRVVGIIFAFLAETRIFAACLEGTLDVVWQPSQ